MNFQDILDSLFGRTRKHLNRANTYRPMLETLEQRLAPATFSVVSTSDLDDGLAANLGTMSLRKAVRLANVDNIADTINFNLPAGSSILFGSQLTISQPLTINGPGATNLTLDGNNATRLFNVDDATGTSHAVAISGLTLTRGNGSGGNGGAILNFETLTVTSSTLSGNSAGNGGGIFNDGTLTVTSSTISGNSGTGNNGGGIFNLESLTVISSTISGNSATFNGGGIASSGTLIVTRSSISGNSGTNLGGGILSDGTLIVTSSTISGNSAKGFGVGAGAGIYGAGGAITVTSTTISGNSADSVGGGIVNVGTLTVTSSTIFENSASHNGGGIFNNGGCTLTVTNSTISGNSTNRSGGGISNDGTLTVTNSTLVANRADADGNFTGAGGGIFANAQETLQNTLVAGNLQGSGAGFPDDINGGINSSVNSLVGDPNSAGGIVHDTDGNIVGNGAGALLPLAQILDPILRNNGGPTHTHALVPGSAAINTGDNAFALDPGPNGIPGGGDDFPLPFDQRGPGFPRILSTTVDIGAFEMPLALFTDDFERSNSANLGPNWTTKVGTPGIVGNLAARTGVTAVNLATVNGVSLADADVVAAVDLQNGQQAGLVARYAGKGNMNYYLATLGKDALGNVVARIVSNVNGVNTELAVIEDVLTATGTLRFRVVGNGLHLFLNNELLASVIDSRFAMGQVGLFTMGATDLDDFAVYPVFTGADRVDLFTLPDHTTLGAEWTNVLGFFKTTNNQLQGGQANNLAVLNAVSEADVDLRTSVNVAGVKHTAALIARQAGKSHYLARLTRTATGFTAQIVLSLNGKLTTFGTATILSSTGKANLRFRVTGMNLQLFVNEARVLDLFNSSLKTGSVGIQADNLATLDNLVVQKVRTDLPFADNFDQPDGLGLSGNWTRQAGAFQTLGNQAIGTAASNFATLVGVNEMHVAVEATITLTTTNHRIGLLAAHTGPGDRNYYMAEVIKTATGFQLALVRNVNGIVKVLGSFNVVGALTGPIRFELLGTSLKLFMNGALQLSATDGSFKTGSVGIRSMGTGTINDFSAMKLNFLPFTDNFTADTLNPNWAKRAGGYTTTDPVAPDGQAIGTTAFNLLTLARFDATDVDLQAYIDVFTAIGEHASLVARYSSTTNYYFAQIARTAAGMFLSINKMVNGVTTTLASTNAGALIGTLRFRVVGNELTLFFQGNEQLSVTDFSLKTGSAGFRSSLDSIFDDFSATAG